MGPYRRKGLLKRGLLEKDFEREGLLESRFLERGYFI